LTLTHDIPLLLPPAEQTSLSDQLQPVGEFSRKYHKQTRYANSFLIALIKPTAADIFGSASKF
jgi:hypothetical protein